MREFNAILTIAFRDLTKLLRDKPRILAGLVFPVIFIGILGGSLSSNIGKSLGFDFLTFVFTGVFAQVFFQSSAAGVISLIQDRENDFSQELFVAPVSRHSIIFGKILGETLVSSVQIAGILIFGLILGVPFSAKIVFLLIVAGLSASFLGGAFGVMVLSNLSTQRTMAQIFPFVLFPQIFLSGVFAPLENFPPTLALLSKIAPLTYAVDLVRHAYYAGSPELSKVTAFGLTTDILIVLALFLVFLFAGTILFVRKERNR
ncbi:MAG: ABC transporter permease [Patescibacteria group bacterium]